MNLVNHHNISIPLLNMVLDEGRMTAYRPRTATVGALPKASYVVRKPEPLGTEIKYTFYSGQKMIRTELEFERIREEIGRKKANPSFGDVTADSTEEAETSRLKR